MQHQLEKILSEVSEELGVPYEVCCKAYMAQWSFIYEKIGEHSLYNMSLDEFRQIRPNFNIPSIGKLCVTEERFINMKKFYEMLKNRKKDVQDKEDKSDV